jgi:hypothetical protein
MAGCKLCGQTIRWNKDFVSDITGKMIPLEQDPNTGKDQPPQCEEWKAEHRRYYNCRDCNTEIYFDDEHISKNSKHIPLDKATGGQHQCDESNPS